jgi:hypothetical protein
MNGKATTRALPQKAQTMKGDTDWKRVEAMTDAGIKEAVAKDPDTFIPDAQWMKNARVVMPQAKEMVTLRLDPTCWRGSGNLAEATKLASTRCFELSSKLSKTGRVEAANIRGATMNRRGAKVFIRQEPQHHRTRCRSPHQNPQRHTQRRRDSLERCSRTGLPAAFDVRDIPLPQTRSLRDR